MNIKNEEGDEMIGIGSFSSLLFVLAGMLAIDTVLCARYLKKLSESLLELIVTILIGVIAKLLCDNPNPQLDIGVYPFIAMGLAALTIGVMFYHLHKIIITSPNRKKRRHNTNPAERKQDR